MEILLPSWIAMEAQGGFFGTFSMLFRTLFWTYPEMFSLLWISSEVGLSLCYISWTNTRREQLSLKLGRNILKSDQHRNLLPPYLHDMHGRDTRHNRRLLQPVKGRTMRYLNSTIPYLVTKLNEQKRQWYVNGILWCTLHAAYFLYILCTW